MPLETISQVKLKNIELQHITLQLSIDAYSIKRDFTTLISATSAKPPTEKR